VPPPRFLILAEGAFGPESSKTANSAIRYIPAQVAGVLDGTAAGRTAQDVLGFGGPIPVVATLEEGLVLRPTALLIGIAPRGGRLPEAWREWIRTAIERGLDVWSGLHTRLADDPDLAARARERGVRLRELRAPPGDLPVANGRARDVDALVVLTVGSDCNTGKMTAQLEVLRAVEARGLRTRFVATGQTGILIAGGGIAVDAVVADFIGGAAERMVLEAAPDADVVLVEGQGSLIHPGYSGVTLGLLHGTCPAAMILCHNASRSLVGAYHPEDAWRPIPPLPELVRIYEEAAAWVHPSRVIGVALNTMGLADTAAAAAVERAARETGLPAADPVRFGSESLAAAVVRAAAERRAARHPASA
jgi:D-glutamate N-acetyltransferase